MTNKITITVPAKHEMDDDSFRGKLQRLFHSYKFHVRTINDY